MKHVTELPKNSIFNFHFNVIIDCTKKSLYPTKNRSDFKKKILILFFTVFVGISVAIQFYYNTFASYFTYPHIKRIENSESSTDKQINKNRSTGTSRPLTGILYPKVPEGIMTYKRFKSNRQYIANLGEAEEPKYSTSAPICHLKFSALGPISANKTELKLKWVEEQYPEIKPGGFYAPVDCRPRHRVAILVPFRNREKNLIIFLYHMHKFLKKQYLLYRIFVIEQYGHDKFNKGSLYNVAYIISQQFGRWHCLIFHDVDLLPLNEQIFYSCPRLPTHLSSAVESFGYELPYPEIFGGVTALTPSQYETVNGYSNYYWNWGAEDDDMFIRLQARRYPILRYSKLIGRYATLPHERSSFSWENSRKLHTAKKRYQADGLKSLEFKVNNVTKKKLFTHILTDINPRNIPHKK